MIIDNKRKGETAKLFLFTLLGISIIFSIFIFFPVSLDADLTDEGIIVEEEYEVTNNWEEFGELQNLETDSNLLYPEANEQGTWTSLIQEEKSNTVLRFTGVGDARDGTGKYIINSWEESPEGQEPDQTFEIDLETGTVEEEFEDAEEYNYFQVEIDMEETGGNSNKRPHVDEIELEWVQVLDRQPLGLSSENFQLLSLMVLIGAGILAMMTEI